MTWTDNFAHGVESLRPNVVRAYDSRCPVVHFGWWYPVKFRFLAALAVTAAAALVPTAASAAPSAVPADSCYGFYYSYTTSGPQIRATAVNACPGSYAQPYLLLERYNPNGGSYPWTFVTSSSSGSMTYTCVGATPNTYHIGPVFTP